MKTQILIDDVEPVINVKNRAYASPRDGEVAYKSDGKRVQSMKRKAAKRRSPNHRRPSRQGKRTKTSTRPTTIHQYNSMSQLNQQTWDSVAHVISRMREGVTLPKASKEFGVSRNDVIELGRSALRKRNGRYVATKTDRLLRVLNILKVGGKREIATRDSRQASLVGGHWSAVQKYLQIGDDSALLKFKKKSVTDANGRRHRLLTNLQELVRQGSAGVLRFESMYAGGSR